MANLRVKKGDVRYQERMRIALAVMGDEFKKRDITLTDIYNLLDALKQKLEDLEKAGLLKK